MLVFAALVIAFAVVVLLYLAVSADEAEQEALEADFDAALVHRLRVRDTERPLDPTRWN